MLCGIDNVLQNIVSLTFILNMENIPHDRGCHTSFFPFSESGERGRGTLSLGRGPFSENGEWFSEKVLPHAYVYHPGHYKQVHDGWQNILQIWACE